MVTTAEKSTRIPDVQLCAETQAHNYGSLSGACGETGLLKLIRQLSRLPPLPHGFCCSEKLLTRSTDMLVMSEYNANVCHVIAKTFKRRFSIQRSPLLSSSACLPSCLLPETPGVLRSPLHTTQLGRSVAAVSTNSNRSCLFLTVGRQLKCISRFCCQDGCRKRRCVRTNLTATTTAKCFC